METEKDVFDFLLNAGSDQELWLLIAGPAVFMAIVVGLYAIYVAIRRRREKEELDREIEAESRSLTESHVPPPPLSIHEETPEPEALIPAPPSAVTGEPAPISLPVPAPAPAAAPVQVEETPPEPDAVREIRSLDRASWLSRLKSGLARTRDSLMNGMQAVFTGGRVKLSGDVLERLHEVLYRADVGVATADKFIDHLKSTIGRDQEADWETVRSHVKSYAESLLRNAQAASVQVPARPPMVILVVGVNGVGKTTTIGKLGAHFLAQGKKVMFCAGDTFRAAAIDQLQVWGDRIGVEVIRHQQGSDPAAVAYDGVKAAIARSVDVLIIDTAGRLHNKNELMEELGKINRVIGKDLPGAPHETWLVIDATTGQNAVMQVKAFREVVRLSGLVVTKLDGTAKGGVVVGICDQFGLPVRYIGVGEKAADLREFNPADFADSML